VSLAARIYIWVLLALCVLIIVMLIGIGRGGTVISLGMLAYSFALVVILLGLHRWRGGAVVKAARVLSAVWAAWGVVGIGVWLFVAPPGLTPQMALGSVVFFSLLPGILCTLVLRQINRGSGVSGS